MHVSTQRSHYRKSGLSRRSLRSALSAARDPSMTFILVAQELFPYCWIGWNTQESKHWSWVLIFKKRKHHKYPFLIGNGIENENIFRVSLDIHTRWQGEEHFLSEMLSLQLTNRRWQTGALDIDCLSNPDHAIFTIDKQALQI